MLAVFQELSADDFNVTPPVAHLATAAPVATTPTAAPSSITAQPTTPVGVPAAKAAAAPGSSGNSGSSGSSTSSIVTSPTKTSTSTEATTTGNKTSTSTGDGNYNTYTTNNNSGLLSAVIVAAGSFLLWKYGPRLSAALDSGTPPRSVRGRKPFADRARSYRRS